MDQLLNKLSSTELSNSEILDHYRIIRGQIEHEDDLIGSRISWFVTSQSFLFSAYAIIATSITPGSVTNGTDPKHTLLTIIPAIGIITSILLLLTVVSGFEAMNKLRSRWNGLGIAPTPGLPPIHGSRLTRLLGMAAPMLLPFLFMAIWIFLLVKRLF
jgi:hypothetical protein